MKSVQRSTRFKEMIWLYASMLLVFSFIGCPLSPIPSQHENSSEHPTGSSSELTAQEPKVESSSEKLSDVHENKTSVEHNREHTHREQLTEKTPAREKSPSEPAPEPHKPPKQCPPVPNKHPVDSVTKWTPLSISKGVQTDTLQACGIKAYRIVLPAKMKVRVDVSGLTHQGNYTLEIFGAKRINRVHSSLSLAHAVSGIKNYVSTELTVPQSGEFGILLHAQNYPKDTSFQIEVVCTQFCTLKATRFPIVLLHGFAGTDKYFGFLDYFYKVKEHLTQAGFAAFTPKVQPIANSANRVLSLKKQIDAIFQQTGARKLNLIAHSQGGVDGRLLISKHQYGGRIASLTTISTPHRGIPIPNLLIPPSQELGEGNMKKYNTKYPNDPRIRYFSWAGVSCGLLDRTCQKKYKGETIDPLLIATFQALKALRGANDGVVPLSSAKWGTFLGEIPADHWDEIGQVADTRNRAFNHKKFYLDEAHRIRGLGF